jgi:hypothetical protein
MSIMRILKLHICNATQRLHFFMHLQRLSVLLVGLLANNFRISLLVPF